MFLIALKHASVWKAGHVIWAATRANYLAGMRHQVAQLSCRSAVPSRMPSKGRPDRSGRYACWGLGIFFCLLISGFYFPVVS
jgi:hypothetical protein